MLIYWYFYLRGLLLLGWSVCVFLIVIDSSRLFFKKAVAIRISLAEQERRLPSVSTSVRCNHYFCQSHIDKVLSCYLNLHPHCIVWASFMFILLDIWVCRAVISYSCPFLIFNIVCLSVSLHLNSQYVTDSAPLSLSVHSIQRYIFYSLTYFYKFATTLLKLLRRYIYWLFFYSFCVSVPIKVPWTINFTLVS